MKVSVPRLPASRIKLFRLATTGQKKGGKEESLPPPNQNLPDRDLLNRNSIQGQVENPANLDKSIDVPPVPLASLIGKSVTMAGEDFRNVKNPQLDEFQGIGTSGTLRDCSGLSQFSVGSPPSPPFVQDRVEPGLLDRNFISFHASLTNNKVNPSKPYKGYSIPNYAGTASEKSLKPHEFGCLLLPLPDDLRYKLSSWSLEHIPEFWLGLGGFEFRSHCTIAYGFEDGNEATRQALRVILARTGPLRVKLGNLFAFPAGKDGVSLCVAVESPQLHQLHADVVDVLQVPQKWPEYKPHVTLAYLKDENVAATCASYPFPCSGEEVWLSNVEFNHPEGGKETTLLLSWFGKDLNGYRTKGESYFSECERDELGHCLPSGETSGKRPTGKDQPEKTNRTSKRQLPKSEDDANNIAFELRDQLVEEGVQATNGDCVTAAYTLAKRYPEAEVWAGNYEQDPEQYHLIVKLGNYFIDVTADQFPTGPDVKVFTEEEMKPGEYAEEYGGFRINRGFAGFSKPIKTPSIPPTELKSLNGYYTKNVLGGPSPKAPAVKKPKAETPTPAPAAKPAQAPKAEAPKTQPAAAAKPAEPAKPSAQPKPAEAPKQEAAKPAPQQPAQPKPAAGAGQSHFATGPRDAEGHVLPKGAADQTKPAGTAEQIKEGFDKLGAGAREAGEERTQELAKKEGHVEFSKPEAVAAFEQQHPDWVKEELEDGRVRFTPPEEAQQGGPEAKLEDATPEEIAAMQEELAGKKPTVQLPDTVIGKQEEGIDPEAARRLQEGGKGGPEAKLEDVEQPAQGGPEAKLEDATPQQVEQRNKEVRQALEQNPAVIEQNNTAEYPYSAQEVAAEQDWHQQYVDWLKNGGRVNPQDAGIAARFLSGLLNPKMGERAQEIFDKIRGMGEAGGQILASLQPVADKLRGPLQVLGAALEGLFGEEFFHDTPEQKKAKEEQERKAEQASKEHEGRTAEVVRELKRRGYDVVDMDREELDDLASNYAEGRKGRHPGDEDAALEELLDRYYPAKEEEPEAEEPEAEEPEAEEPEAEEPQPQKPIGETPAQKETVKPQAAEPVQGTPPEKRVVQEPNVLGRDKENWEKTDYWLQSTFSGKELRKIRSWFEQETGSTNEEDFRKWVMDKGKREIIYGLERPLKPAPPKVKPSAIQKPQAVGAVEQPSPVEKPQAEFAVDQEEMTKRSPVHGDAFASATKSLEKLPEKQRAEYAKATKKVLGKMPPKAVERMKKNMKEDGFVFHPDRESIANELVKRGTLTEEQAKSRGGQMGGVYLHGRTAPGQIHVDGEHAMTFGRNVGKRGWLGKNKPHQTSDPSHVYAHEFAHAVDGPTHEISGSDEWKAAWQKEIVDAWGDKGDSGLSKYATTKSSEGFAEFGRLLYAHDMPLDEIEKKFPLTSAVWKKHGIWPE